MSEIEKVSLRFSESLRVRRGEKYEREREREREKAKIQIGFLIKNR